MITQIFVEAVSQKMNATSRLYRQRYVIPDQKLTFGLMASKYVLLFHAWKLSVLIMINNMWVAYVKMKLYSRHGVAYVVSGFTFH